MILNWYLNMLKRMVKNKSHVEGSIYEAYLSLETSHICSYYFESHVQSMRTKVGRNDFGGQNNTSQKNSINFQSCWSSTRNGVRVVKERISCRVDMSCIIVIKFSHILSK